MSKAEKKAKKKDSNDVVVTKGLAERFRPRKLSQVVGQDAAVNVLNGMFAKKQFPSTMMFSGHYGCGKTSLAYIFGAQINCATLNLCGECFSCKFSPESHPDIVYHDCGTNGKIDDIRALIAASRNAPTTRKRIIIVDEVHMLRDASEKAMLVEAERPSHNTIWILCTTNPEKVAKPLVSRCTHMPIRPIAQDVLVERMQKVAKKEGVKLKDDKLLKIAAEISNGSMREALSVLEKIIHTVNSGAKMDEKALGEAVFGEVTDIENSAAHLMESIANGDLAKAMHVIRATGSARALLIKLRWLCDYLIGKHSKTENKWSPYSYKIYAKLKVDVKPKKELLLAVLVQQMLCEIEVKLNSVSIDENVMFYSAVGSFIAESA